MRFDDRLATVLAQPEPDFAAVAAKWRQLLDLMAQHDDGGLSPEVEQAVDFLRRREADVPITLRRQYVAALPRPLPSLIEAFEVSARQPETRHATPGAEESGAHIRELAERIGSLRKTKAAGTQADAAPERRAQGFHWESGAEGIILWVDGAPRGPLVGQSIASAAAPAQFGVDGQAAGAFARRAPFRDARFKVAGAGAASGDWRISGVPYFDPAGGHFLGYRGSARRPRIDEDAAGALAEDPEGLFGTELQPDSLRQLIHELRTPLNAILGFAEMIDGQFLGPAADSYRSRAVRIREQAAQLLSAVDDLDTAARIETSRFPLEESVVDATALLNRLYKDYEPLARQRNAGLALQFAPNLPLARVETDAAERMFARMLAATIGLAREGETLSATMSLSIGSGSTMLCLAIARPESIRGLEESELLDPGYSPEGDWPAAPALGLGFALRLVRNLAEAVGGSLRIDPDRFLLFLPPFLENGQNAGRKG